MKSFKARQWLLFFGFIAMFVVVAGGNALAERIELPAPLSDLLQAGAFVETGGVRFSNFGLGALQEGGTGDGVQLSQRTMVSAQSSRGFSGLSLQIGDGGYSTIGPSQFRQWVVTFDIEPQPSGSTFSLVRLAASGSANGGGSAMVDVNIFDDSGDPHPPLPIALQASSHYIMSDGVTIPSPGSERLWASIDISLLAWQMNSSATVMGATLRLKNSADVSLIGDYDYDNDVDGSDFLVWQRQFGTNRSVDADGNFDGKVDTADYVIWRKNASLAPVPGDFNGDGVVNGADYTQWRQTFGGSITPHSNADGSGNGTVDAADYVIWRKNKSPASASSSSTAVPEPALIALLTGCVVAVLAYRLRR